MHSDETVRELRKEYFDIIDETIVNKDTYMIDIGCGSGRWTDYFVDKAAFIEAIDPSDAVLVADRMLGNKSNVRITKASVDTIPWDDETFDFGMSIGVLHHIPDTRKALESCVKKIKKGGHFYVYLYYRFDNRGFLFKTIFLPVDLLRLIISRMPAGLKRFTCDVLAVVIYWPLSRFAGLLHKMNLHRLAKKIPLEPYHNKPFYNLRNDCLVRFRTKLERRFLRSEIEAMMTGAGLTDIRFVEQSAFGHAVGKDHKPSV
ncbi:MAG: class I SAM-dependent methyltransferase [Chitinophagaceae bacterium]|nr:class I SAM-dependent methyltransferase [Chitinophagaceae bacterium]